MTEETFNRLQALFENCPEVGELVAELNRLRSRLKAARKVWADERLFKRPPQPAFWVSFDKETRTDRQFHLVPVEPGDEE